MRERERRIYPHTPWSYSWGLKVQDRHSMHTHFIAEACKHIQTPANKSTNTHTLDTKHTHTHTQHAHYTNTH